MKIVVAGDFHGQLKWAMHVVDQARSRGISTILQVGDFGLWEHIDRGAFLNGLANYLSGWSATGTKDLGLPPVELVWIDGNHENFDLLRDQYMVDEMRTDEGFYLIRRGIKYADRGHRWTWGGRTFLALGGAYSIDKSRRTPGHSWWPQETITAREAERAADGGHAEVMVTHDAPTGLVKTIGGETVGNKDSWPESYANRMVLRQVVEEVKPTLLLHGHYHNRYTEDLELDSGHVVRVEGLGRDGQMQKGWVVLDLGTLEVTPSKLDALLPARPLPQVDDDF